MVNGEDRSETCDLVYLWWPSLCTVSCYSYSRLLYDYYINCTRRLTPDDLLPSKAVRLRFARPRRRSHTLEEIATVANFPRIRSRRRFFALLFILCIFSPRVIRQKRFHPRLFLRLNIHPCACGYITRRLLLTRSNRAARCGVAAQL